MKKNVFKDYYEPISEKDNLCKFRNTEKCRDCNSYYGNLKKKKSRK